MTDEDARIIRATTHSIKDVLSAAAGIASRMADARSGQPVAIMYERLYLAILDLMDSDQMKDLQSEGVPPSLKKQP